MVMRKQKKKPTRETQISENSRAARNRAKQDFVYRMVVTYPERKKEVMFTDMWKIINDAIDVNRGMTQDRLKRAAIIQNQNISNNQLLDK